MNARTRKYITDSLLTTKELSALIGVSEITLKKRYERNPSLAILKGRTLLWSRKEFEKKQSLFP